MSKPLDRPGLSPEPTVKSPESSAPSFSPTSTARTVSVRARRGEAVALLGFPNSGKTSFLYALKVETGNTAGVHPWRMSAVGLDFERLTGTQGMAQPATPVGEFRPAQLCRMSRRWVRWLPFQSQRWVVIPEIAGETIGRLARGQDPASDKERAAFAQFWEYLKQCDELIFLASVDGAGGTTGGSFGAEGRRSGLDEASVENSIKTAAMGLRRLIAEMEKFGRGKSDPIFVTFLITKRDQLKDAGSLDRISIPSGDSAVARLVARPGRAWLASHLGTTPDGAIVFRLNDLCSAAEACADADLQEAAAADFLRCHAPKAAEDLSDLSALPGVSLRLFMCAPYGRSFAASRGNPIFPEVEKLKTAMVYESLEDALERSFRWRMRGRLRRFGMAAALLATVFFLTGPFLVWSGEARFQSALNSSPPRFSDAMSLLESIDNVPWARVERALSQDRYDVYSSNRLRLREKWVSASSADQGDNEKIRQLEDEIIAADGKGLFGSQAAVFVQDRSGREIEAFIRTGKQPSQLIIHLEGTTAMQIQQFVHDLRSAKFAIEDKSADDWAKQGANLRAVLGWMQTGEAGDVGAPGVLVGGSDPNLQRLISGEIDLSIGSSEVRQRLAGRPHELAEIRAAMHDALASDDGPALVVASSLVAQAVEKQSVLAIRENPSGPLAGVSKELSRTQQWPAADQVRREYCARKVADWLSIFAKDVFGAPRSAELRARIDAQSKWPELLDPTEAEFVAIDLGGDVWLTKPLKDLRPVLRAVSERAKALRLLAADGFMSPATETAVRESFDVVVPQAVVSIKPAGMAATDSPIDIGLGPVWLEQQGLAVAILDSQLHKSQFQSGEEVAVARRQDKLLRAFNARIPAAVRVKMEDIDAAVGFAEALLKPSPVANEVCTKFVAVAKDSASKPLPDWVLPRISSSKAAARLVGPILENIAKIPGMQMPERQAMARGLIKGLDLSSFGVEDTVALMAGLRQNGLDPVEVAQDSIERVQASAIKASIDKRVAERAVEIRKLTAWLNAAQGMESSEQGVDSGPLLLRTLLKRAYDSLYRGDTTDPGYDILIEVAGGDNCPSAKLHSLVLDIRAHLDSIKRWNLKPVMKFVGDRDQCMVWLSQCEWTIDDVASAVKSMAPASQQPWLKACKRASFPLNYQGASKPPSGLAPTSMVDEIKQIDLRTHLSLRNREDAMAVVSLVGLRLPTFDEWNLAASGISQPVKEAILLRRNEKQHKDRWARDDSAMALREFEDVTGPPAEFVGMAFGVREWASDRTAPLGGSNLFPTEAIRPGVENASDIGVRPALDVVPGSLAMAVEQFAVLKPPEPK